MTPIRTTQFLPVALVGMAFLCTTPALADHYGDRDWERKYYRYDKRSYGDRVEAERRSAASMPRARAQEAAFVGDQAAEYALRMIGIPYRYGGSSPSSGFDCSGLVQFSYRQAGVNVPRTTDALRQASLPVRSANLQRGDLVFFHQEGKRNGHVGMYLGAGEFIHAPSSGGSVRRDSLHSPYWRRHFSQARRLAT